MRSWQVETQCPQCGAPVTLKEAQHVLSCSYCKTRLYLTPNGPFRYAISPKTASAETIYIPFWRIKGLGFTAYLPPKTAGSLIDKTYLATDVSLDMVSLGTRPQVMRLGFANSQKGLFIRPRRDFKRLLDCAIRQLNSPITERETIRDDPNIFLTDISGGDPFDRSDFSHWSPERTRTVFKKYDPVVSAFLDEGNSLVYFPVTAEAGDTVILSDGLTNRPIGKLTPSGLERLTETAATAMSPPGALPLLCPNCGWDLDCAEESRAVLCPGCDKVWEIRRGHYASIPFEVPAKGNPDAFYLPFWKIKTTIPRLALHDTRDLARFANQSHIPRKPSPLHVFIPAFKMRPRLFLQLCKVFTCAQPETHPADRLPKAPYPILLKRDGIREMIPIVLAEIGAKKARFYPNLNRAEPAVERVTLAFLPFRQTGYEAVYEGNVTFAIPRNVLKWGRKL